VTFGAVVQACADEAARLGVDLNFTGGRTGHSIGLHLAEPPSVTLDNATKLEPGMTFTLEPGIVNRTFVFVIEQNLAVTEDGYDLLTEGPWEIWVAQ
jgi:Xaa-Pro aminopeptidase